MKIEDFSSKELAKFFEKHISSKAKVTTDKWRGYIPLKDHYKIEQEQSQVGINFQKLHTMIHQLKSWIRTTYSWVSPGYYVVVYQSEDGKRHFQKLIIQ